MPDSQREIEKELSEQYDKNKNKNKSLLYVIYVLIGIYISIISYNDILKIFECSSIIPIILVDIWLLSIVFALFFIVYQFYENEHKFEKRNELIQILEGEHLEEHNRRLYKLLDRQTKLYFVSIILISCIILSSFYFYVYLLCVDISIKEILITISIKKVLLIISIILGSVSFYFIYKGVKIIIENKLGPREF